MRAVDMSAHRVVWSGLPWPVDHHNTDTNGGGDAPLSGDGGVSTAMPSTRDMLARLERNEAYVSWLQPSASANVEDQIPAIQIAGRYYTISLRMMKAVWRHVRLKKGFQNREHVPHVGPRLRIPMLLLAEKIRTQQRFRVAATCDVFRARALFPLPRALLLLHHIIMPQRRDRCCSRVPEGGGGGGGHDDDDADEGAAGGGPQAMRLKNNNAHNHQQHGGGARRARCADDDNDPAPQRKRACPDGWRGDSPTTTTLAQAGTTTTTTPPEDARSFKDMLWVVTERVLCAQPPAGGRRGAAADRGGGFTRFELDESELFANLVYQIRRDCPAIASSAESLDAALRAALLSG